MARARKACSHPGCYQLQPCPEPGHTREAWAGSTRRSRLPKGWEKRRRYILTRDPICKDGRVCRGLAMSVEVDHVVPGDDHSHENLQGICRECHAAKSAAEGAAARRAA